MDFLIGNSRQPVNVLLSVAPSFKKYIIPIANAAVFNGDFGSIIRQQIDFDILTIWYDVLLIDKGVLLHPLIGYPVLTMHYVLKNAVTARLEEDREIQLNEGQFRLFSLLPAMHDVMFKPGLYIVFSIEIRNAFLQKLLPEYPELKEVLYTAGQQQSFVSTNITIPLNAHVMLHNIIDSKGTGAKARVTIEAQAKQLLLLSLDELATYYKRSGQQLVHRDIELLHNIKAYIVNNLGEKITIACLSKKFGITATRLKRVFKLLYHTTIHEFVVAQKLEKARLLLQMDIPVNEVAYQVGYTEPTNFIRAFKRYTGITPAGYKGDPFNK